MKILVAGATGFIGQELLKKLYEKGHDIVVLTRDAELAGVRLPVLAEVKEWSLKNGDLNENIFDGVDAVVHLAGADVAAKRWTKKRREVIRHSRLEITRRMVATMAKLKEKPHTFIVASAVGFYGDGGDEIKDESSNNGEGFLADLCLENETEAFQAEGFGVRTVALRIGIVLGNDGGALRFILPIFNLGLGGPVGNGKQWMSWIHVRDMAGLIRYAIEQPALSGPVNAVAPNPVTNAEFSRAMGKAIKRPALLPAPGFALNLILGQRSEILLTGQRVSAAKATDSGYDFEYPDLDEALSPICDFQGHELRMEQWVPVSREKVFAFFSNAKNLEALMPPHLGFKVLGVSPDPLENGSKLDYRLRLHGIPFHWQSEIYGWKPDSEFSDRQSKGPYVFWKHSHEFIEKDGGTVIRDSAHYKIPGWIPGDILLHGFIRADLEKIFIYRRQSIKRLLKD